MGLNVLDDGNLKFKQIEKNDKLDLIILQCHVCLLSDQLNIYKSLEGLVMMMTIDDDYDGNDDDYDDDDDDDDDDNDDDDDEFYI